jgi:hypothetical protein
VQREAPPVASTDAVTHRADSDALSQTPLAAPNRAYYRAVTGRWSAAFALVITDWAAFRRSAMSAPNRLSVLSLLLAQRLFGAFRLDTSVDAGGGDEVVHTTRVSKWGVTLLRSIERIRLAPNGRDATMRIEMRIAPAFWRIRIETDTPVVVDASASRASYRFTWFGVPMRQEAERNGDGTVVTLLQTTSFSRSEQRLRRQLPP